MKIVKNDMIGKWAVPKNHPYTVLNNAPWPIQYLSIKQSYSSETHNCEWKMYIRGEGSCWFAVNDCFISNKVECEDYCRIHNIK